MDTSHIWQQALPLMEKYTIPVTPENFAVWYHYISGDNDALKDGIDKLIERNETVNESDTKSFYNAFINPQETIDRAEAVHQALLALSKNMIRILNNASWETNCFEKSLEAYSDVISDIIQVEQFKSVIDELSLTTKNMTQFNRTLLKEIDDIKQETESLRVELEKAQIKAKTDALTAIANREAFIDHLEQQYSDGELAKGEHSLIMADIDNFKQINDQWGHLTGDKVIRVIAQVLQRNTKRIDYPARFGGEEFVIYLPHTGINGARSVAESIRKTVQNCKIVRPKTGDEIGQITLSLGVTTISEKDLVYDAISRADEALYEAKAAGRNCVVVKEQ